MFQGAYERKDHLSSMAELNTCDKRSIEMVQIWINRQLGLRVNNLTFLEDFWG